MTDDLLLPEGARLLHIGPHKTGSTAIQVALFRARDELARHGAFYPGGKRRRREASEELFAALGDEGGPSELPLWNALREEVAAAGQVRVCVSDEQFGKAKRPVIDRIVDDLGDQAAHVLAVARPYDSYLPSQWQERVKAGRTESWEQWLRIVLGDGDEWERWNVWHAHDTAALVERWVERVGPERFTLLVADESDREQLPRVFEAMLGLPAGLLRLDPDRSNRSLSFAEVELIRGLNTSLRDQGVSREDGRPAVRAAVRAVVAESPGVLGPRRPVLPGWAAEQVAERSRARVEAIRRLPVRVVGDPDHLLPAPVPAEDPPEQDDRDVWIAASAAGALLARAHARP